MHAPYLPHLGRPGGNPTQPSFCESGAAIVASFDGAFEPRGTKNALGSWGIVIKDSFGRELHRSSDLLAKEECDSNNVAEYIALRKAIAWALANADGRSVLFQGDSQLVVHHCRKVWGWNAGKTRWVPHAKHLNLLDLLRDVMAQLESFPRLATRTLEPGPHPKANNLPVVWVRGENNPADEESRKPLIAAGLWK